MFLHPIFIFIKAERGDREARCYFIMKKTFGSIVRVFAFAALMAPMVSCEQDDFVTSLRIAEGETIEAFAGDEVFLHLEHSPSKASLPELEWYGFDPTILWAFPNQSKIIVKKSGSTPLTIATADRSLTTSCTINVSPITVSLSDTVLSLHKTDTFSLKATLTPERIPTQMVWSSSDDAIAEVDNTGKITAKAFGLCVITCSVGLENVYEPVTAQCRVAVDPIAMTSLVLDAAELELELGKTHTLAASYEPSDATYTDLYWSSSDESVAKVVDGKVEAVGLGSCVISVTNSEGNVTAQCEVSVYSVEMTSLVLSETKCEIALGESHVLKATYEPDYVTLPKLTWSSSDAKVAKVVNGKIEPTGVGTCIISVANHDESQKAQCEVSVYLKEIAAISCLSEKTLEQGEHFVLSATYEPSFVSPGCDTLYWESSDESVATVNKETGEVTCVGVGECTITVGNTYNDVTATCRLTVLPISVKSISLNKTSLQALIGKTYELSYTINPDNAANKEVKWESSDNSIATVAEDGTVTPISKGKATIKVTAQDGSNSFAECVVEVMDAKSYVENYISIRQTGFSMTNNGISYTLTATNNGDVTVYLKEVRGYGSMAGSISIKEELTPGRSYSGTFNTDKIDWVFEINGVECVKRY